MTKYHQSHVGNKVTIYQNVCTIMQMWDAIYGKILRCTMTDTITIETLLVIENKTKIM
jgi:predicted ribonuclease toxin of YeeF-YezG toxin-antitoxin module